MNGIEHYRSRAGIPVIRVHYSADPDKSPETDRGRAWLKAAASAIVGGTASAQWRAEMEIDWDATGGELVFPQFALHKRRIVVAPFEVPDGWPIFGSFDYGHRNPSCFLFHAIDYDGVVYTVWEHYRSGEGYRDTARAIRACPLFRRLSHLPVADPSLWGQDQQDDNDVKSVAQLFFELPEEEQVIFGKAKRGGDVTFAEKINGEFWRVPEEPPEGWKFEPRWRIFANCPNLIRELERIRFAEWGPNQAQVKNLREQIVDRENHAFDASKYFFTMFFGAPRAPKEDALADLRKKDPISYQEWMSVQRMYRPRAGNSMFGRE